MERAVDGNDIAFRDELFEVVNLLGSNSLRSG